MPRVIVGMSGGVDSTVTAYLLKIAGYDVIGVTLRTSVDRNRCCEITSAEKACDSIGIPYYVINCVSDFDSMVVKPFIRSYLSGHTPNPCIPCNRYIKWGKMLEAADRFGAEYIATGHYASVTQMPDGRYTLKQADYAPKDQTYMLYRLTQEQLKRTIMPLGKMTKAEVRQIANEMNLPGAQNADSQEICFVPEGSYADFIEENTDTVLPPKGFFVSESGERLGTHGGIYKYTVGQRKGLGLALGYPAYIKSIDGSTNSIVISDNSALYSFTVLCGDVCFMGIEQPRKGEKITASVKIRYNHKPQKASVEIIDGGLANIIFDEPVRAAAPGQSAVFYDDEQRIIGGGIIVK